MHQLALAEEDVQVDETLWCETRDYVQQIWTDKIGGR